tara:strand:- start:1139 stop:1426 length:288 start_codon:yes stop_codon:yes gene_type:complete
MFSMKTGDIKNPMVRTSMNGGLSVEDYAEICTFKIISVADSAPPAIKEQAKHFKEQLKDVIQSHMEQAVTEERNRCIAVCVNGGHDDVANILRRI